jgi:hypothetical protein
LGYHCVVLEDCVYDPSRLSGAVALADLAGRYADVMTSDRLWDAEFEAAQAADVARAGRFYFGSGDRRTRAAGVQTGIMITLSE